MFDLGKTFAGAHDGRLLCIAINVEQFWIQGTKVVGPDNGYADVGFWPYPTGGSPTKKITGLYSPFGAVVSLSR